MKRELSSRDWFGKASAGLLLGLAISLGLSGLLSWALGVGDTYFALPGQFTMWAISPLWCGILSFCFLFRSGPRAWTILGLVTALVWFALFATEKLS